MEKFELRIGEVEFSDQECTYRNLRYIFWNLWNQKQKKFLQQADEIFEIKDKEQCLGRLNELGRSIIIQCAEEGIIKTLISYKIFSYDLDSIQNQYELYEEWEEQYKKLSDKLYAIIEKNQQEHAYREYRKATRNRWEGGGFSVSGAIKGAVTAGVFNGITGVAHSVGNTIGNTYSDYQKNKKINSLFSDWSIQDNFENALKQDVFNLTDVLVDILVQNGYDIKIYKIEDINQSIGIYNNYDKIQDLDGRKMALLQCFKLNPYDYDFYGIYMEEFYKNPDVEQEYERLCSYFMCDLDVMKQAVLLKGLLDKKDKTDAEKVQSLEVYIQKRKEWKVDAATLCEREQIILPVHDLILDKENVKYNSESDFKENSNAIKRFRQKKEMTGSELQTILSLCRFSLTDGELIDIDNAEEALELTKARIDICKIWESYDYGKREEVLKAVSALDECNKKYHNKKLGRDIRNYIQYGVAAVGLIFDFTVIHKDYEQSLKKFASGEFYITPVFSFNDEGEIVYANEYSQKTYYPQNNDEKTAITKQIEDIRKKYENINFEDEKELTHLKFTVQDLFDKCGLGENLNQELDQRLNYLDKCLRTVLGTEYATRKEADEERKKVVDDYKYETVEEADTAKKELKYIYEIIGKDLNSADLDNCFANFQNLKNYNFCTPNGRDKIAKVEKILIERYKRLCEDISSYEKNKTSLPLWKTISIIGTLIAIPAFFGLGIIGKIICVCIVCALWQNVLDKSEKIKKFNLDNYRIKGSIDNLVFIQNNTIKTKTDFENGEEKNIRFCTNCGAQLHDDMTFCPMCGEKLKNK